MENTKTTTELELPVFTGDLGLSELADKAYENSKAKGFWDDNTNIGEKLMLICTEVAEAMEAYRNPDWDPKKNYVVDGKLEGIGIELADVIIRTVDLANFLGLDITELVRAKMAYNLTRTKKHGGKRA